MSLIREVMEHPLDPGYTHAAERKASGARSEHGLRKMLSNALVLLVAVAIGLGGVWAARDLRTPVPGANARSLLIEQIRDRSATSAEMTAAIASLQGEIQRMQAAALGDAAVASIARAQELGISAGTTPVVGPGLVLTVSDSAAAQAGELDSDGRVQDFDLQMAVNSLWVAGAEAIAINGIRLTGSTAIRTAGEAVLVDLRPLASPYTIEVIGDADAMRTDFARTEGAAHLSVLTNYGITSQLSLTNDLSLPAGTAPAVSAVVSETD